MWNDDKLRINFANLEERQEQDMIRESKYKLKMAKYYN